MHSASEMRIRVLAAILPISPDRSRRFIVCRFTPDKSASSRAVMPRFMRFSNILHRLYLLRVVERFDSRSSKYFISSAVSGIIVMGFDISLIHSRVSVWVGCFCNSLFATRKRIPAFRMLPHLFRADTGRHISRTVSMIRVFPI